MKKKNNNITVVIGILISIIVIFIIIYLVITLRKQSEIIAEKDQQIIQLTTELEESKIADVTVYTLANNVKAGAVIKEEDFIPTQVPYMISVGAITDLTEYVKNNYKYKLNIKEGQMLTENMLLDYVLEDDMRYLEVILDEVPLGLAEGDYVDVRIAFPLSQDYIVMNKKRVVSVINSTVTLIVQQADFYAYESMKTDKSLYSGTKTYASKYVEAGIQTSSKDYYPVNLEALQTMKNDPNINMSLTSYKRIISRRASLEKQLLESDKVDKSETVTDGRNTYLQEFKNAVLQYEADLKAKEEASKEELNNLQTKE